MSEITPSPYAQPVSGLRVREGAPAPARPTREEIAAFPAQALALVDSVWDEQKRLVENHRSELEWVGGKHFLIAGGTGQGLGGALATALLQLLAGAGAGSLTVISRDLTRSLGYESGVAMRVRAESLGFGTRFHWINDGLAMEGEGFGRIVAALGEAGAGRVVYFNAVAAAIPGLLPGYPPVYVLDLDEEGPFQWKLTPLDRRAIELTRFFMGTLATGFPHELEKAGVGVEAAVFFDWRGSLDRASRDPASPTYGRQGPYSTSLYIPKEIVRAETRAAYGTGRVVLDFFLPIMKTRALEFIPGGRGMWALYGELMRREGIRRILTPELAVNVLGRLGGVLSRAGLGAGWNPFPRLDAHEAPLDLWFAELSRRLTREPGNPFHYKKWVFSENFS